MIIGIVVGIFFFLAVGGAIFFFLVARRKRHSNHNPTMSAGHDMNVSNNPNVKIDNSLFESSI